MASQITGAFPAQRGSNVENVSISWSRHAKLTTGLQYVFWFYENIQFEANDFLPGSSGITQLYVR